MMETLLETRSVIMQPMLLVTIMAPEEDVERILAAVIAIAPLPMGSKYDCNTYQTAAGIERYCPLQDAAAGQESEVRKRPGVVELKFEIPHDRSLLQQIVECVFQVRSYQEPVIRVAEMLASRSRGLDGHHNTNRWWNTTEDWMSKFEG